VSVARSSNDPELLGRVRRRLAVSPDRHDATALAAAIRDEAPTAGLSTLLDVAGQLGSELHGAGPLAPLLAEPGVTDVLVNGAGPVWVDRGDGPRDSGLDIPDEETARRLAVRLVAAGGRRLDDAAPYADARLADGVRVHAVIPPLAPEGTCISLRVPPRRVFTLDALVAVGALPPAGAELLERLISSRLAFLITGGTGTGKTTVLSSLLSLAAPGERIVLVEDAAELRPAHPHVVRMESRPANSEGVGAVSLDVLVRQALRMRPDRLVVGEVRGGEVLDLLAALNTGHEGGCSTVHANRAEHLPARIESLCGQAGVPRAAAHSLLVAAVDVVLHLMRGPDGRRRMAGLGVVVAGADGLANVVSAYRFTPDGVVDGAAADVLRDRLGVM
jgi:pilus assembly protein CpaF